MLSLRIAPIAGIRQKLLHFSPRNVFHSNPSNVSSFCPNPLQRNVNRTSKASPTRAPHAFQLSSLPEDSSFLGVEDALMSYLLGNKKATEVAHLVWKRFVRKGDTVIDATCGNGYDTLAMLKLVADESTRGCVYGLDVQKVALENTSSLLEESVHPSERELVNLFQKCHSKMVEVLPEGISVRLIAFNLGYLPGGDKTIITESQTTLEALKVSNDILMPGGLISLLVYVGHPGGWQELETVEEFSSTLSAENWTCCKFQMLNRPLSPILVFMFKKC